MQPSDRRTFLKSAAVVSAATIVPRHVLGGPGHIAPSDRVNVALIGAGGRGLQNARELMKLSDVRISTVIDPAERWDLKDFYYRGVSGRLPVCSEIEKHYQRTDANFRCQGHVDFRRAIEDLPNEFDAVLCATPDHLHASVSLRSLAAGKHVYCEKPLTHNIAEARLIAKVAEDSGLATQMGNQGHSTEGIRQTCEWLRSGVLGELKSIHSWVPATRWNPGLTAPPTQSQPVPKGLDWDLWCGPRQPIDFNSAYAPVSWRDFWQFGLGAMGDFGCHDLDSAVWGLELGMPTRVEMFPAGQTHSAMIPFGEVGYFDFAATKHTGPIRLQWYSGGPRPAHPDAMPDNVQLPRRGVLFVGEKGVMVCGGAGGAPTLYPLELQESSTPPQPTIKRSAGHHRDWIDAIKGGDPASSEFGYGAKLTEVTLLGVLALRTASVIDWNQAEMKATGVASADPIIHGDYRDGWKLDRP
ncbi:Glucose--fructose oxidoreductase precursor [Rubripirellula lacrimiformis]|uniref:Glucose--fructose oxidoreductase n=1 Tax=Rubripirellula lacrimiformis TaxID=1930273 RepID=A0A517NH73_9BACT|nr:Gfo/Idh/MocA family oxidoreductase [Rubripirellula lacrimiformis]QDT06486.1 Glucose--fructose oxidoreductase precursor [Rubripirellula lacrimiformis]